MFRRVICFIMSVCVLFCLAGQTFAASQTGSVCITLEHDGAPVDDGGILSIYKVGEPVAGGYRLENAYGGGLVTGKDTWSAALAQWLAERAGEDGIAHLPDAEGNVVFSALDTGLYLIVQTEASRGYYPIAPFLLELPYLEQWHLQAKPKMEMRPEIQPNTGDSLSVEHALVGMAVSCAGLLFLLRKKQVT